VKESRFRFEPMGSHHDRKAFDCGVEVLDRYLQQQAGQDVRNRVATVLVMVDSEAEAIAGYYTLSATSVSLNSLSAEITKNLSRYPTQPAILLGRLAVDRRYRGQGLGELLLFNALKRSFALSDELAAMAVVVDAKDDRARSFYERFGFVRLVDDEYRLVISMKIIQRS
jgi:predicted GNAT family N-acyltransferase